MRIFFLSHGCTYSADTGGQIRTYELNKCLSNNNVIFQVSINPFLINKKLKLKPFKIKINEKYEEMVFNSALLTAYSCLSKKFNFPQERYLNRVISFHKFPVMQQLDKADICITSSPWLAEWMISNADKNKPLIYAPADILVDFYKNLENDEKWLKKIKSIEGNILTKSTHIITVSKEDKNRLIKIYNIDAKKISIIPNGVNTKKFGKINRLKNKHKLIFGVKNRKVILFIGGKHPPSLQAIQLIESIAPKLPEILFYVVGGVGESFKSHSNIVYTGRVNDVLPYFAISDLAINPITTGTGSNIKLLEYLAAGIPCVSTKYGIRATALKNGKEILLAEDESQFVNQINFLLKDSSLRKLLAKNGKKVVERYDWNILAQKLEKILKRFS